jgi:hypothetical protein
MLKTLDRFSATDAAGVVARYALKLRNDRNPAAAEISDHEEVVRSSIASEISQMLGDSHDEQDRLSKTIDLLDKELEKYSTVEDSNKVLLRLAQTAQLPSDLYKIEVIPNIRDFYGARYASEYKRIVETVHKPDSEQHFGPAANTDEPALISIFARYYRADFPRNSFNLLVVGQRNGLKFDIHQVWRIHPDSIPQGNYTQLIDVLKAFADVFGVDIDVDGKVGRFFLTYAKERSNSFSINLARAVRDRGGKKQRTSITFSHFIQNNPEGEYKQASLVVAIDLDKYGDFLKQHDWK